MDLRERLKAMNGGRPVATPPRRQAGIESVLTGVEAQTAMGSAYIVEQRVPLAHPPLNRLGDMARWPADRLMHLTGDARLAGFEPARMVVLDTETTGLAGGTGTYTFMIGLGVIEDDAFVTRQYFLRTLTEERAMLAHLATVLRERTGMLTYNGRTFDWPLLLTRFTLTRQRAALVETPHWDLLPLARRLWRARFESCSLGVLEASVLGQPRHDDTPGWLIPQLYFDYLRDGDARRLVGVFDHNRRDLIALAGLAGVVARWLADPFDGDSADGSEWLAVARHDEQLGRDERAIALYRRTLERAVAGETREVALRSLSLLLKRHRRWPEAVELWHAMLTGPLVDPMFPAIELAKHCEHVARDLPRAIALVERLRADAALRPARYDVAAIDYRLARLYRRLERPDGRA